ncbi:hypothetical protein ACFL11_00640 [Patescibacteria group bacterium]
MNSWARILLSFVIALTIVNVIIPGYDRSDEQIPTIAIRWWGPRDYAAHYSPLPDGLELVFDDGRKATPEEMVLVINPELNPTVREGRVYLVDPARTEWDWQVSWLDPGPVTTPVGRLILFFRGLV